MIAAALQSYDGGGHTTTTTYTKHNVLERDAQRKMMQRLTDSIMC